MISNNTKDNTEQNSVPSSTAESITIYAEFSNMSRFSMSDDGLGGDFSDSKSKFDAESRLYALKTLPSIPDPARRAPVKSVVTVIRSGRPVHLISRDIRGFFGKAPARVSRHVSKWFAVRQDVDEMKTPRLPRYQTNFKEKELPEPPYHVFTFKQKKWLVYLVSAASSLGPLSASIYLPATAVIAKEFHVSTAVVLQSVSIYLVVQGLAPLSFLSFFADLPRRPAMIAMLLVCMVANIGLAFSKTFAVLMILRVLQAAGSSILAATGAAIIGDIATTSEKSELVNLMSKILMLTFISPILGGILANSGGGFHCIFWFLFALSSTLLLLTILVLPETLRRIAGNGTIRLKRTQLPLLSFLISPSLTPFDSTTNSRPNISVSNLITPLKCLRQPAVLVTILSGGVVFAICSAVIATTTPIFTERYLLSPLLIGLAFLPVGTGSVVAFALIRLILSRDLQSAIASYQEKNNIFLPSPSFLQIQSRNPFSASSFSTAKRNDQSSEGAEVMALMPKRQILMTRLNSTSYTLPLFILSVSTYGFSFRTGSAVLPLFLQFCIAASGMALLGVAGAVAGDLAGTEAGVAGNVVRFLMGGLAVGVVELVLRRVGLGMGFLIAGVIAAGGLVLGILFWVVRTKASGILGWVERCGEVGGRRRLGDWSVKTREISSKATEVLGSGKVMLREFSGWTWEVLKREAVRVRLASSRMMGNSRACLNGR